MNQPKPRTTFPKDYIVSRVEARLNSAKKARREAEAELNEIKRKEGERKLEWLAGLRGRLSPILTRSEAIGDPVEANDVHDQIVQEFRNIVAASPSPSYRENQREIALKLMVKDLYREIETIEHSIVYLRESPVEEYSMTLLTRLGLMEAVKFALVPKKEKE